MSSRVLFFAVVVAFSSACGNILKKPDSAGAEVLARTAPASASDLLANCMAKLNNQAICDQLVAAYNKYAGKDIVAIAASSQSLNSSAYAVVVYDLAQVNTAINNQKTAFRAELQAFVKSGGTDKIDPEALKQYSVPPLFKSTSGSLNTWGMLGSGIAFGAIRSVSQNTSGAGAMGLAYIADTVTSTIYGGVCGSWVVKQNGQLSGDYQCLPVTLQVPTTSPEPTQY